MTILITGMGQHDLDRRNTYKEATTQTGTTSVLCHANQGFRSAFTI